MSSPIVKRDSAGRLVSGTGSLNPGGYSREIRELKRLARREVPASFATAVAIRDNLQAADRDRLEACKFLASYGLGAPSKAPESDEEAAERARLEDLTEAQQLWILRMLETQEAEGEIATPLLPVFSPPALPLRDAPAGGESSIDSTPPPGLSKGRSST